MTAGSGATDWSAVLAVGASVGQIITASIAVIAGIRFLWRKRNRRLKLEDHLKMVLLLDQANGRNGLRTPMRLSADLGFTIEEIHDAAFSSNRIERKPHINPKTKRATAMFLRYKVPGRPI